MPKLWIFFANVVLVNLIKTSPNYVQRLPPIFPSRFVLSICTVCIRGKWSDFWATQIHNKLHSVQPTLGCGSLSNRDRRREQLVLCRLRLGHTYTTHMYLLAGEDPPVCVACQENYDSGTHRAPLCRVFSCPIPMFFGGRRSPAVACWASDHWVASSNPLRGKVRH